MSDWHGWRVDDVGILHVGPLPGRKSICVYVIEGSVMTPVAYCRSEDDGDRLVRFLDAALARPTGEQQ